MNLLIGLILGIIGYFVAHLLFNEPISALIGLVIGLSIAFGWDGRRR